MFGEKYNEMRLATYKSSSISPLLMAEEFIKPSVQLKQNRINDFELLTALSESNDWITNLDLKRIMKPFMAVVVTDLNKKIIWVSGYFETMTGYSMDEVINQNPKLLQGNKTDAFTLNAIRQKINHKKTFKGALTNYKKNKESYECNVEISPIFNSLGNHVHYIAFETDRFRHNA
jgi:PAS domain S-box-containing protein